MHFGAVSSFQGLNFTTSVRSDTNIAALVGRNGAGKSRLLQAIASGNVEVFVNGAVVQSPPPRLLRLGDLSPALTFHFDPHQQREQRLQAIAVYNAYKGKFHIDPVQSVNGINTQGHSRSVNVHQVAQAVSKASVMLGKDVNALDDADLGDYFSDAHFVAMGGLNVTGIVRAYVERVDQNKSNDYRNHEYGEQNRFLTDEQFRARFGPPPWHLLNQVLSEVLDGRYQFEVPVLSNIAGYNGKLIRVADGLVIEPGWLSSGEKVLMWLCLSMYATASANGAEPPKLLLLDEPDSALHPEMVQKLHMVLKRIANVFGCGIMFTTHSPTSVALFDAGPIWQVSEHAIVEVEKDFAIRELLVGLDQISLHYTKCKQVYVESHNDEDVYTALFNYLRRWNKGVLDHIALSFIPAAPKLAPENVRNVLKAHFGDLDAEKAESFVQALNGQGDCMQVIGAVQALNAEGGIPVHGIIDWDLTNAPNGRVRVLGQGLFYNLENAVLNPLTLGIYLLQNFREKLTLQDYGLTEAFDLASLYTDATHWQAVADGVTRRAVSITSVSHDIACHFLSGAQISLDLRYAHMNGHHLEDRLRHADAYPFLNSIPRRQTLMMEVVQKVVQASQGRIMPMAFVDLFVAIQAAA